MCESDRQTINKNQHNTPGCYITYFILRYLWVWLIFSDPLDRGPEFQQKILCIYSEKIRQVHASVLMELHTVT
jgi:hypothetical protein